MGIPTLSQCVNSVCLSYLAIILSVDDASAVKHALFLGIESV